MGEGWEKGVGACRHWLWYPFPGTVFTYAHSPSIRVTSQRLPAGVGTKD